MVEVWFLGNYLVYAREVGQRLEKYQARIPHELRTSVGEREGNHGGPPMLSRPPCRGTHFGRCLVQEGTANALIINLPDSPVA